MQEVLLFVKCGSPLSKWYRMFASGDTDPRVFQEQTEIMLNKYCPVGGKIVHAVYCENSATLMQLVKNKFDGNDIAVARDGNPLWFATSLSQIKWAVGSVLQKK